MTSLVKNGSRLKQAGIEYKKLKSQFKAFCIEVHRQVTEATFFVGGISCEEPGEDGIFRMAYLGKSLTLVFSTQQYEHTPTIGLVTAYLSRTYPTERLEQLHQFTFDNRGKTNMTDDERDDMYIDGDHGALEVALYVLSLSLAA